MAIRRAEQIFLDALLERCISFSTEVRNLQIQDFPSKAPEILANCLFKASETLINTTNELIARSRQNEDADPQEVLGEASSIYDFVDFSISYLCPIIRSSVSTNVPSELVRPLERIASSTFPQCQVLIGAVPELNYYFSKISPHISELFTNLGIDSILSEEGYPEDLFHLQLCSNPPCGILAHCMLGHELGHAIYEKVEAGLRLRPRIILNEETVEPLINARYNRYIAGISTGSEQQPTQLILDRTKEYIAYLTRIEVAMVAGNWVKELFCDIIGTGLFGPSYICSLSVLLLPFSDIDQPSHTHPSNKYRIQTCIHSLERSDPGFGYRKLKGRPSETELEHLIQPWREVVGNRTSITDPAYKAVSEAVIRIRDEIVREAKSALEGRYFSPSKFMKTVPILRNRIRNWLPPNEYQLNRGDDFKVAGLEEIFNAGWLAYLQDMEYFRMLFKGFTEDKIKGKFHALLSKGVESSDIQMRWKSQENRLRSEIS